jgi:hypothetical protein
MPPRHGDGDGEELEEGDDVTVFVGPGVTIRVVVLSRVVVFEVAPGIVTVGPGTVCGTVTTTTGSFTACRVQTAYAINASPAMMNPAMTAAIRRATLGERRAAAVSIGPGVRTPLPPLPTSRSSPVSDPPNGSTSV